MGQGTGIIIGMSVLTVGSAIMQGIFSSLGKQTEVQYLDLATKSLLAVTAVTAFTAVVKSIMSLG